VGTLEIGLLGPLRVSVDGQPAPVTAGRLRVLLAVLAMSAGEAVSVERLAAAVWNERLPADPRRSVQTYVTRLRGVLGAGSIATSPTGYALRVAPDRVDALRFGRLLDAAAVASDAQAERTLLAEALALWRGVPFEGMASARLEESAAPYLVERRLAAVERRVDLDIEDGRAGELVAELSELVARWPLRESLWVRLLVVLDRCGRQAEALDRYEAIRVRLAEELGADPGAELQAVHADLLAGRPAGAALGGEGTVARSVVPRQLPVDIDGFTGRRGAMEELEELLGGERDRAQAPPVICAVAGTGGIGKSALAIHAAHRLAERFPDGQLYVNLQGATPGLLPLAPLEVLGRFLRALGAEPAAVPTHLEEAAAVFRSRVAGRRLLMVLDDAADAAQVRPLLPGSAGAGVLVTSRRVLSALDGVRHMHMAVLAPEEAVELLGRLAGRERVAAEPEAAAEVARLCGWLPLGLRIAGGRLAVRPTWPISALAKRLADVHHRLDELELAEVGVRASFTVSVEQLRAGDDPVDRAAAEAFGLLGLLDGPEVGVPVVARLLEASEERAEGVLERLVDAQLLETPAPGRYRLHDLLRLYARELADRQSSEVGRATALSRALGFYTATAWHTFGLLRPGDYRLGRADDRWRKGGLELELADEQSALGWLEAERANLLAAVQQAAATPGVPSEIAIQLAQALWEFFWVRSRWDDCLRVNQISLEVARRLDDRGAEAQAHHALGFASWRQGRYDRALSHLRRSLAIHRELGDRHGQAGSLSILGLICQWQGRYDEALASQRESLAPAGSWGTVAGRPAAWATWATPMSSRAATSRRSPASRRAWPSTGSWATASARPPASSPSARSTSGRAGTSRRWPASRRASP
jgi:DNA-binding SARP family transcriptional activator/tetratricopeptide (TPR) repeat protein